MIDEMLAPASLPPGQRVYAVGDIHGCADRLAAMHAAIAADLAERPVAHSLLVHLGDYIDRGPDSAGVIARLIAPFEAHGGPAPVVVNLMGNHEDMLLTSLEQGQPAGEHWLSNGGGETLASWGVDWRAGPAVWSQTIPPVQLGFLRGLSVMYRAGGYIFAHAGMRPGVRLESQSKHDLLWIRDPFLTFEGRLPGVVVHGHTPESAPIIRPHRIGIDTGAVMGGALSCAVLQEDRVGFLQT